MTFHICSEKCTDRINNMITTQVEQTEEQEAIEAGLRESSIIPARFKNAQPKGAAVGQWLDIYRENPNQTTQLFMHSECHQAAQASAYGAFIKAVSVSKRSCLVTFPPLPWDTIAHISYKNRVTSLDELETGQLFERMATVDLLHLDDVWITTKFRDDLDAETFRLLEYRNANGLSTIISSSQEPNSLGAEGDKKMSSILTAGTVIHLSI